MSRDRALESLKSRKDDKQTADLRFKEKRRMHMQELYETQDTERRLQAGSTAGVEKEAEVVYNRVN